MTAFTHQPIVRKLNRRRALAPLWEMAFVFSCVFAAVGLLASIGYACADLGAQPVPEAEYKRDSDALRDLMNGKHYMIDKQVLTCTFSGRKA